MAVTINWATKVISVLQADLDFIEGSLYELDVDVFRLALRSLEDSEEGMAALPTHRHNAEVTLSGVTYARSVEIINGYTLTFEDVGSPYRVRCVGANHNLSDVQNLNDVSLIIGNSAGLITVVSGSGVTEDDKTDIITGVWTHIVETLSAEEIMRVMLAAVAGKRQGIGTATEEYMGVDEVTPRITLAPDSNGNGTPVVDGAL